ncbi:sigma-70 family RNA polymerase sigma factor [Conexibacter woesei]|uniref:sigma-70 family RNA polymerase sigma factor n=1 Tax=Conexibacter woesei TaxID=191495 RepID=UPI000426F0DF|nr:sigma-70 family RNA polymerase sigma factor [Conexibacter woesei]
MPDPDLFLERRLFARYADPGDPVDAEVLIRRYLPLARSLAARFRSSSEPFDDLLQVAVLGLLKAIRRFDPHRGIMFSSYATPTIMGELRRHFRDTTWLIHVPRDLKVLGLRVDRSASELALETGRRPTAEALARRLDCDRRTVLEGRLVMRAHNPVSLEVPRSDAESDSLGDTIGTDDAGFGRALERGTVEAMLRRATPREREILRLRFEEDLTQREIGRRVGLSQMHVSRILQDVLARLRRTAPAECRPGALAAGGRRSTAPRR